MNITVQDVLGCVVEAKRSSNGHVARCPAHDDTRASLSITEGADGKLLLHCYAGCDFDAILTACHLGGSRTNSQSPRSAAATYIYVDANGHPLYRVHRTADKRFWQERADGPGRWVKGLAGVTRVPYRLPALRQAANAGQVVFFVEGEKDVESAHTIGLVATTLAGGAAASLPGDLAEHFRGVQHVVILPDNDDPGRKYAHGVAEHLTTKGIPCKIVTLPNLPAKGDLTDWLAAGGTREGILALVAQTSVYVPLIAEHNQSDLVILDDSASQEHAGANLGRMSVVALCDVPLRKVEWLWQPYLPVGKLVVVDGYPGQGKSTFAIDIAARLSRGHPMPDGTQGSNPADTLILTYEDDAADTLRPRLEAAGGDPTRVHHIAGVTYTEDDLLLPPSLPRDLELLDHALMMRPGIRLVIIDPLAAALGAEVDSHRDQDVRRVLAWLSRLAADRGVCVVIIRHVRKSHGGNAITAGGGSIGIIGQARIGLLVDRHPEDHDAAVLAMVKSNLGPFAPSLTFRKVAATLVTPEGETINTSRLDWTGTAGLSADELLASHDSAQGGSHDEANWLRDVLAAGPMDRKAIMKAANAAGFAERTIDRVAKGLGIVKERVGFGAECRSIWGLTSTSANPAMSTLDAEVAAVRDNGGSDTSECASPALLFNAEELDKPTGQQAA